MSYIDLYARNVKIEDPLDDRDSIQDTHATMQWGKDCDREELLGRHKVVPYMHHAVQPRSSFIKYIQFGVLDQLICS